LATLKGFGEKTQAAVKANIEFKLMNSGKRHYAAVELIVNDFIEAVRKEYKDAQIEPVGAFRRKCEVLDEIELLCDHNLKEDLTTLQAQLGLEVIIHTCEPADFAMQLFELTATQQHLDQCAFKDLAGSQFTSEEEIYETLNLQYIEPELREGLNEVKLAQQNAIPELITLTDLKGILHNHTTYSDGVNTLKEMADACNKLGYEYLGICDHSRSAFYANGLDEDRIIQQHNEIDKLNSSYQNFKILKGIESDILNDGALDYSDEVLGSFDFIVASVHSNLKMTEEKATQRLIKAIENPYTTILGHPTGRLLLARQGYPIDHKKVIDACAANGVHMELNAHPYRLDIDWRWIWYCLEKNVKVSINPDAHQIEGYHDMYYGVCTARKGMLSKEMCLNALGLNDLIKAFKK
jgi:DNA polymerase (family 10)